MSRPALPLPTREPWAGLAGRIPLAESIEGLERFDLLAHGTAAAEVALHLALEQTARVHALVIAAASPPADRSLAERVGSLSVPVLALFGTRDAQVPPATGRDWRALLPGCHIVFVYDAASDMARDRPEAFAEVVLDFLAEPGAFLVNRASGVRHP
ncbi:MAG: alpha/beta fold hydrolase [Steroidobacteraceae bacterium]